MNLAEIMTIANMLLTAIMFRVYGWPGTLALIVTYTLLTVFWK